MNPAISLYLDAMRLIAALLVFMGHAVRTPAWVHVSGRLNLTHDAVMAFFVLSGYVIAYAADQRERDWKNYLISRATRIYSVALPVLLIAFCVDAIGMHLDPAEYSPDYHLSHIGLYLLLSLTFLTNVWWMPPRFSFPILPYWSVTYEVWYYFLFALGTYLRGPKRVIAVALALILMGPKMLLLLPLWLLGVQVYRWHQQGSFPLSRRTSLLLWFLTIGVYVLCKCFDPYILSYTHVGQHAEALFGHGLDASNSFAWDWVFGCLVALHIYTLKGWLSVGPLHPTRYGTFIRWGAARSFSFYLLHPPLLSFFVSVLHHYWPDQPIPLYDGLSAAATLLCVLAIAQVTELQKPALKRWVVARLTRRHWLKPSPAVLRS